MERIANEDPPDALVVSNDPAELGRVGAWVNAWSRRHGVPVRTAERLDLCSAEVVTNIMTHACTGHSPREISLRLDRRGEVLSLEIEDDGQAFDPRQIGRPQPTASLEEARIGGLGIHLVRSLTDELRHRRSAGRNHLTLIFQLPPE